MGVQTGAGVKFYIGTTAAHSNQTEYEADTYAEVLQVESIGDYGDNFEEVRFIGLSDARTQKKKGSADAGDLSVTMAFNEGDSTGQADLISASEDTSSDDYNFKIEFNDGTTTPTTRYFSGQVASCVESVQGANSVVMLTAQIRINTAILKVAAT